MKDEDFENIVNVTKDWFYTDFDIQIEIRKGKRKGWLVLESDAYYWNGKRYRGKLRHIVYSVGNDELCKELEKCDIFFKWFDLDETLDVLHRLKDSGFKLA